ncbi:hypothetical protein [Paenimyroides ceti]
MAIYNANNHIDRHRATKRFIELISDSKTFELKEIKPIRTLRQNRYLHLILSWFGMETGYTLQEVKQIIFKQVVNYNLFYDGEYGELKVQRWRSTADLKTDELTTAIDNFRNYSSTEAGIYLPEPSDLAFLNEIDLQIKQQKYI